MMRIADASFVVVDTETTGGRAADDRLIEIGAVEVQGGRITRRFEELINPECAVPRRITALTGISTAMVFDQPNAAAVLPRFANFLANGVIVAHNLTFDAGFLNRECARAGRSEFGNRTLCTLRLARRLLTGLRSKRLSSIADFYGIRIRRHHRALADAEATAEILLRFIDQLELEFGVERLDDLLAFQHRRYSELRRTSANVARIRAEVLDGLPDAPGVYFMKDGRGKVIYVGKAQNLNSRVRSYFTAVEGHPPRIRQMVKAVRDVSWEEADSELDAMILESRLIKEMQPSYNRAQRRYVNRPFIRIDTDQPFPRVRSSAFLHHDGAEYYGPLSDRDEAAFLVGLIDQFFRLRECDDELFAKGRKCVYASLGRCTAPCELGPNGETARIKYDQELGRVRAFLGGEDDGVLERIEEAMLAAAADLDYEQAGIYRDWRAKLQRILSRRGTIASRVLEHNAVIIHQKEDRPPRLLLICRGRHVETLVVKHSSRDTTARELTKLLDVHLNAAPAKDVYREQEIDEIYVLSHWLYVHRHETTHVHLAEGESFSQLAERAAALVDPTASTQPQKSMKSARAGDIPPAGTLAEAAVLTEGQIQRHI